MRASRRVWSGFLLLVAVGIGVAWSGATVAQPLESGACRKACYERKEACVDACSDGSDPIRCASGCEEDFEDCTSAC